MKESKYIPYMQLLIVLLISILMSFLVSNSAESIKINNDLPMYTDYYSCLTFDTSSILECNDVMGKPYDFFFNYISYFFKIILGISDFSWYLFFLSFFIYFSIIIVVTKVSPLFIISVLFLLTDFRFWEYGSNVLRAGLAVSIFLIIFNFLLTKKSVSIWNRIITIIPSFAHTSGFVFILPRIKKYSKFFLLVSLLLTVIFVGLFNNFFNNIAIYILPEAIYNKIDYYYVRKLNNIEYAIPSHYFIILFVGFISIWKNWIGNKTYIYTFNVVWILFLFTIVFSIMGMGYRIFGFMTPFLAILISYQIKEILLFREYRGMAISAVLLLFILICFKNYELIIKAIL